MKKFSFPLDTVLGYKEQILDGLKGEHAKILAKVRECEREIEALEKKHRTYTVQFEDEKRKGMTVQDMHTYENYLESISIQIKRTQKKLEWYQQKEEEKRAEVVEARQETSSIEKLKEKKLQEYRKMEQKDAEQTIEEFVTTKKAMVKLNG